MHYTYIYYYVKRRKSLKRGGSVLYCLLGMNIFVGLESNVTKSNIFDKTTQRARLTRRAWENEFDKNDESWIGDNMSMYITYIT